MRNIQKVKEKQSNALKVSDFIDNLKAKKVLLLSSRDLRTKPLLYGEDNYMSTFMSELRARAIPFAFLLVDESKGTGNLLTEIDHFVDNETLIILHNVSPFYIIKVKFNKKPRVVMPVYFLSNRVCSMLHNLNNRFGPIFWQLLVDEYLVASPAVAEGLKKVGMIRKINIVPPQYSCAYCNYMTNQNRKSHKNGILPSIVNVVYIGKVTEKRFPLLKIIKTMNDDKKRNYKLVIYTSSTIDDQKFQSGNVEVTMFHKKLSEKDKCEILSTCDTFIAPSRLTTMDPPISVIEAEYHGAIVLNFKT